MSLLETQNLTLRISKNTLCENLNLQVKHGEIWGILGSNGSGKTTLLKTFAGLHIAKGEIRLNGKSLSSTPIKEMAQIVGILFQESRDVFPLTVSEYCSSGRYPHLNYLGWETTEDRHILQQALIDMELTALSTQNILTLSGGERRRLSIATLLAQSPQLYLLDEPTNHLDLRYQIKILNHFQKLAQSKSVSIIMSLHDINLAAHYCDRILLLLGNGQYLSGTTKNMLNEENLSYLYQHPITHLYQKHWLPRFD